MTVLAYSLLGLAVGSFLNLCIDRLPEGRSIISPSSHCEACGHRLATFDLVPVLSYLWLRGRCRYCAMRIPLRTLAVELGTGLLFALLGRLYDNTLQLALATLYILFLIVILVVDLERRRILNRLVYPGLALGLLTAPFVPHHYLLELLGGGLVGFGLLFLIALAYPGGMGLGDVKLAAFIGLVVGFPEILVALFLSFVAGGIAAASLMLGGFKGRRDPIPFGPFLAIGGMVSMLYGETILTWSARL